MTKKKEVKMYKHYAAIDIGSNAVRLLIKRFEKNDGMYSEYKELMLRIPLRLGFDVFKKNRISRENIKQLTRLMKGFSYLMKIYDVKDYLACATSAIRDAQNGEKVTKSIREKTGVHIHILNGRQEALGICNTSTGCFDDKNGNYMYVDVGGGSTEISMLSNGHLIFSNSYNIGTIRILCDAVQDSEWVRMNMDIAKLAQSYTDIHVIGTGGNINKLYRLIETSDKKRKRITVESLSDICNTMANMTVEERMSAYSLKYDRADVIVPAGSIFLAIMEIVKSKYIYVPTIGLPDGIINMLFEHDMKKYKRKHIKCEKEKTEINNSCVHENENNSDNNVPETSDNDKESETDNNEIEETTLDTQNPSDITDTADGKITE